MTKFDNGVLSLYYAWECGNSLTYENPSFTIKEMAKLILLSYVVMDTRYGQFEGYSAYLNEGTKFWTSKVVWVTR